MNLHNTIDLDSLLADDILHLWDEGLNSADIADLVSLHESQICRLVADRQDRQREATPSPRVRGIRGWWRRYMER